jgi:tight adherence protein C
MPSELLIPILVFVAVAALGSAIVAVIASRRSSFEPRLRMLKGANLPPVDMAEDPGLAKMAARIGESVSRGRTSLTLKEQLARAGYYHPSAAATYLGAKLVLLFVGIAGMAVLMSVLKLPLAMQIYLSAVVAAVMFFIPNMVVASRRNARRGEVRQYLPDAVDLLEICVSAGLGLDMAWNAVGDEIRAVSPVLGDEMALATLELQLGAPRTVAMRNMAQRTGAQELASLVALLVQSERFGTSLAESLRTFAESMRDARSRRAEEAAEKTAVKLLFPLVLFIFPVMLIVTVGPAGITLYRIMSGQPAA